MRVRLTVTVLEFRPGASWRAPRLVPASYDPRVQVGSDGKPVRIRRGPATVIGDAGGCRPLVPTRHWEGAAGGPGSQETTSDHKADSPRGKGWLMQMKHAIKAGAAALGMVAVLAGAPIASAAAPPKVTITVQGKTKTLLRDGNGSDRVGIDHTGRCAERQVPRRQRPGRTQYRDPRPLGWEVVLELQRVLHHPHPGREPDQQEVLLGPIPQRQGDVQGRLRGQAEER